eukprot:CAMPEP_0183709466 /NCGR_PEP_ID=MMETSP0737-20130205/5506_1 /TAXON_ID=385413 /ORGANISM="Thalassiosira miniscula, Strain CCMP1093" /LENGTH=962 /DNA_ID=CAMNT_0025937581 /DNA_START=179 /DNA_END=3067 /DNA_ORIENTATION=+
MVGFFSRRSAKNPQSGANSFSSSSAQSESQDSQSDANVPTVNLTEQRLQDWRAGGVSVGNDGSHGGSSGGSFPAGSAKGGTPPRNYTTSPNNLILLIERGDWAAATQRAHSHEHEVKQLVKLRKTTKNAQPSSSMATNTGADSSPGGSAGAAVGGGAPRSSGGSSRRNLQISNVKCKALHHACQKLRSVHTTIYQKTGTRTTANNTHTSTNSSSSSNNTRRIIEEDEYIEACKCILTLIRIHPEACKERESRHGCLPLHLCVFSMCATPPPPLISTPSANKGKGKTKGGPTVNNAKKGHHRTSSGGLTFNRGAAAAGGAASPASQRPPVVSSRTTSAPSVPSNPLNIPNGRPHHRSTPSNSSADFSLGNISEMMQEESQHQQALSEHQQSTKNIHKTLDNMERLLIGMGSKCDAKEDKKRKEKRSTKGKKGMLFENNKTPLDRLEERSRETDSHSTPAQAAAALGTNGKMVADERTGASMLHVSSSSIVSNDSLPVSHSASTERINNGNADHADAEIISNPTPTYEDLQRRYLQINTQRRDEYSIRVLNALLDAWPKSSKTSSEGGRLPLHMACFGKATVKVMETILKAYPDAARQRNHDGFLPIHIAAHWGVSHADIAPLILRAYPDGAVGRNRWERTPIEEALGMAGENGRDHQLSLVWSLRRHPTYWIHNDIGMMLMPRNVRTAPWRMVDVGDALPGEDAANGGSVISAMGKKIISRSAVDVDEVGTSDEEDEGVEVQMTQSSLSSSTNIHDPDYIRALAESTDLSLLITKDKHWEAAALRCRLYPHEAREAMEVKVRGAYTAKITPLHYACENKPTVEVIKTLIDANPAALERRQEPGGQLPLHAACTWGASSAVVATLLAAIPACAEMKDFLSNLPLHCACYSGADTVVVEALLRVYPQSVWPRNHQGSSAVDIVRRLAHPNRREVLSVLEKTMGKLLERANKEGGADPRDNSLEWV